MEEENSGRDFLVLDLTCILCQGVCGALSLQCLSVFGAVCVKVSGPAQLQGSDLTSFVQPKVAHLAPGCNW